MTNFLVIASRLEKLRSLMRQLNLDALIVNREDEHLSEYLSPESERLGYITGFTGSAGVAVILQDPEYLQKLNSKPVIELDKTHHVTLRNNAAIFVDGRYTLQVAKQTDPNVFDTFHFRTVKIDEWIWTILRANSVVGIDAKCASFEWFSNLAHSLSLKNITLEFTQGNLIDQIWTERQLPPPKPIIIFEDRYNGCPSIKKRQIIAQMLREKKVDAFFISKSESINWLLNVRGNDVPNLPVVNSFAVIYANEHIEWFVDPAKIPTALLSSLQHHFGDIDYYDENSLEQLFARLGKNQASVYIDPSTSNAWIINQLKQAGCQLTYGSDLCDLPKACKNPTEVNGMKKCHLRDAVAMCRFLAWLDHLTEPLFSDIANIEKSPLFENISNHTEETLSNQLLKFRKEQDLFLEPSFDTISALGPNASVIHYNHINVDKPRALGQDPLYLVDSGGQYMDGTTDITRTVLVGNGVTDEMKERFTLVLKGLIAMHMIKFPKNTYGISLDVVARAPLWQAGLNYDHGTGHGVGHCLNVHEGPQSISQRRGQTPLVEGMVTSIEPGYYKDNAYGIRCENLGVIEPVRNTATSIEMFTFTPITYVPFDIRLIKKELLSDAEKSWLNDYHFKVREIVKEHLSDLEIGWLLRATAAI